MEKYTKYNVSTYFWLKPITTYTLQEHVECGFLNTYLIFEDLEGFFIEYDINLKKNNYYSMLINLTKNENFVDEYLVGNNAIIHFTINNKWKNDYSLFLDGVYSKMSLDYKQLFTKVLPSGVKSLQWKIFDKDEELKKEIEKYIGQNISKDVDYFFSPNLNKETWKLNN